MPDLLTGVYLMVIVWLSLRPGQVNQEMRNFRDRYGVAEEDPLLPLARQRIVFEGRAMAASLMLGWVAVVVVSELPGMWGPGEAIGVVMAAILVCRIPLSFRQFRRPLTDSSLRVSRPRAVRLADYVVPSLRGCALVLSAVLLGVGLWAWHTGLSGAVVSGAVLAAISGGVTDALMAHLIRSPQPAADAHELFIQDALRARLVFHSYMLQAFFCAALCFILAVEAALVTSAAALLILVVPVVFGWLAWVVVGNAHLRFQDRLWAGIPA